MMAKEWVIHHAEEEVYHRLLIQTLMKSGDRAAAIQAYKDCCILLNETSGTLPSQETFALLEISSLQTQTPTFKQDHAEKLSYRPFATVAIAISWKAADIYDLASNRLDEVDTEDAVELIQDWQKVICELAAENGAWLSQVEGSTILAHYGYPDFCERPIRKAVNLVRAFSTLSPPNDIHIGLAIHADLTLITESSAHTINNLLYQTIVPLAWEARHGQVLLSPQAAARMSSWKINTFNHHHTKRYELHSQTPRVRLNRIHGRLQEFEYLNHYWLHPKIGKAQLIAVCGLSGLGKTQLAQAMAMFVKNTGNRVLFLRGQTAFHAIYHWLTHELRTAAPATLHLSPLQQAYEQLARIMTNRKNDPESLSLFTELALKAINHYGDLTKPLLIVLDDIVETDPSTRALLTALTGKHAININMVLGLTREPITTLNVDHQLSLKPLNNTILNEYLTQRTRTFKIPSTIKNEIIENSLGNPLFLEELIHLYQLGLPLYYLPRVADLIIHQLIHVDNTTLHFAYLIASLDQVTVSTAAAIINVPRDLIQQSATTLINLGLLQSTDDGHFVCQHMAKLAIRKMMPRQKRQQICTDIARHFIQSGQPAELIAKQLQQARSADAAHWWRKAILEAQQQGSIQQAAEHITEALLSYQYIQDVELRKQYELESYMTLGALQLSQLGPVSEETQKAYEKAAHIESELSLNDQLPIVWAQWIMMHSNGELTEALQLAKQLQKLALSTKHTTWYGWSLYAEAQYFFWKGSPSRAEKCLEEAIHALSQSSVLPPAHSPLRNHSDALAYSALALAQAAQGSFEEALKNAAQAIDRAQKCDSTVSLIICSIQLLRVYYLAEQLPSLSLHSQRLLQKLQAQAPDSIWSTIANAYRAMCATLLESDSFQNSTELSSFISVIKQNLPLGRDASLCVVAQSYIALNKTDKALLLLEQAQQISEQRNSALIRPEIHCLRGDVFLKQNQPDLAKREWQTAQRIAQHHQLHCYEGWINRRLPKLWIRTESLDPQTLAT